MLRLLAQQRRKPKPGASGEGLGCPAAHRPRSPLLVPQMEATLRDKKQGCRRSASGVRQAALPLHCSEQGSVHLDMRCLGSS